MSPTCFTTCAARRMAAMLSPATIDTLALLLPSTAVKQHEVAAFA